MTTTKYRVTFTEILHGRPDRRCDLVIGDVTAVQAHLDRYTWVVDTVEVIEYVGSDAVPA